MNQKNKLSQSIELLPLLAALAVLIWAFQPIDGYIGHDFYHDFSRFIAGKYHFWNHPFSVPHFIASMCGGIPLFADPQSAYYSVPQALSFAMDPWFAAKITVFVFSLIGYWGAFKLFREAFDYSPRVSHLGALLFFCNGFFFENLFVGHLTHHSYPLLSVLLYLLWKPKDRWDAESFRDATFAALILSYIFYSGGMHILVVIAMSLFLLSPSLVSTAIENRSWTTWARFLGTIAAWLLLACSGKYVAASFYSKLFYLNEIHGTPDNALTAVLRYLWFNPDSVPLQLPFGRLTFGPWEYVGFVSKITIPGLLFFIATKFLSRQEKEGRIWVAYAAGVMFVVSISIDGPLNQWLPFFRHYHNPIKLMAALIPAVILATVASFDYCEKKWLTKKFGARLPWLATASLAIILVLEFASYVDFFVSKKIGIAFRYDHNLYETISKVVAPFPVKRVVVQAGVDHLAIPAGISNLSCYEPLFGYGYENFKTTVRGGFTDEIRDSAFNLNHPGCLVYPDFYHCEPWSRIPASQKSEFEKFVMGDPSAWPVPVWQTVLDTVNLLSILSMFLLIAKPRLIFPKHKRPRKAGRGAA